jgi:hypothetical protein
MKILFDRKEKFFGPKIHIEILDFDGQEKELELIIQHLKNGGYLK